jgi:hypothetical protein
VKNKTTTLMIIIFVAIVLIPQAIAVPDISALDGQIVQGENVTISGSGFGVKNLVAPLKWETFEDGQIDADWTFPYGDLASSNIFIVGSDNHGVSTKNAEMNIFQFGGTNFGWIAGQPAIQTVYVNYWIKKNKREKNLNKMNRKNKNSKNKKNKKN